MSKIFSYDTPGAARIYDKERCAMGADVIAGLFHVYCRKPLKDIHVLDAGCGTGHYTKALIDLGVGKFTLLDASPDMMDIAKEKLKNAIDNKIVEEVIQAQLPALPFESEKFDAVMFNEVLQHLDTVQESRSFPNVEKTLCGAKRVLRQGGLLVITTHLPKIIKHAVWLMQVHQGFAENITKIFLSAKEYLDLFAKYGFKCVSAMNLLNTANSTICPSYFDPEGPLREESRKASNLFEIAEEQHVKELETALRSMRDRGCLKQFVEDNDRTSEVGFLAVFACISI